MPTYTDLQVLNGEVWSNVVAIMLIGGQVNGMIGYYMLYTCYATIFLPSYQKPTNPANNPAYPTGATQAAQESIKDTWGCVRFGFIARDNFQHEIKKQIIATDSIEFPKEKKNLKKLFAGVSGNELMECLMVRYDKINEPIKDQGKSEFREECDPKFPISKVFKRIEDSVQLVDGAKFPWQPEQIIQKTYVQMKNSESKRMSVRSGWRKIRWTKHGTTSKPNS